MSFGEFLLFVKADQIKQENQKKQTKLDKKDKKKKAAIKY